mgnify:CR=1 FL=1
MILKERTDEEIFKYWNGFRPWCLTHRQITFGRTCLSNSVYVPKTAWKTNDIAHIAIPIKGMNIRHFRILSPRVEFLFL